MKNNHFWDVMRRYFEYTLRIGRYKSVPHLDDSVFILTNRCWVFARIVIFFTICVSLFTSSTFNKSINTIVLIITLLWMELCNAVEFMTIFGEFEKENGKENEKL